MIKQRKIDNGRLGGIINTIAGSSYIFGFFTYVNSAIIVYSLVFKYYISLPMYIVLSATVLLLWFIANYKYATPSQNQYIQDQAWKWGSPIRKSFEEQNIVLERIEMKLNEK